MWRHIDVQADWRRSLTYGRAPNAIDISQGSLTCPSKHRHGANLFILGYSEKPPHLVAFYDTLGIRRIHSRLNPRVPMGANLWRIINIRNGCLFAMFIGYTCTMCVICLISTQVHTIKKFSFSFCCCINGCELDIQAITRLANFTKIVQRFTLRKTMKLFLILLKE